jgi:DNA invertase Pin-like site-specific DNA recombinase
VRVARREPEGPKIATCAWQIGVALLDFFATALRNHENQLRKGDVLVVWKLDRLSRSLQDVLTIMDRVQDKKAGFRSLTEVIDTTTPAGRMMMQMVASFAEFERSMLKERTKIGLEAARKDGRIGGRKPKLKPRQRQEMLQLVRKGKKTAADAARLFGVHRATVTRLLHRKLAA